MTIAKIEGGVRYPPSAYLVCEDRTSSSSWHLRVKDADGKPDHRLMGAAWAALHEGYRGNRYEGPQKAAALRTLKALYTSESMDLPDEGGGGAASGGKSAADTLLADRPDLVYSALALLTEFEHGEKIGRKHSKKDREVIRGIVAVLGSHFLADDPDHDGDDDSGEVSSPSTPLAAAGAATGS